MNCFEKLFHTLLNHRKVRGATRTLQKSPCAWPPGEPRHAPPHLTKPYDINIK